jgi:hypothetical protein
MKNNFFSNTAPVIPTGAKRSGGIFRLTHNATIKAGAHVSRFLGKLGMTVLLLSPVVLSAQNGVEVTGFNVDAGTVTFDVSWDKNTMPVSVWSDTVWVFVDYNDNGVMKRLPLTGATLTATSAPGIGRVKVEDNNNKGVWVVGNAKTADAGSFSAAVALYYNSATAVAGACAYASNYPPVGKYISTTHISFTGTPMYNIVLKNAGDDTIYRASGSDFDIPEGYTLVSFTDTTGAPGTFSCVPPTTPDAPDQNGPKCVGTPITFTASIILGADEYEWQGQVAGAGTAVTSNATTAGTYSAKVRAVAYIGNITCYSGYSDSTTATINPLPTIAHLSGGTYQTVEKGLAIDTIKYTTANATGVSVTGLPSGVSGLWDANTYTLSGTINPSSDMTAYSYIVTPVDSIAGCTGSFTSGSLSLMYTIPPYAVSSTTKTLAGLTWSAPIKYSPTNCTRMSTCSRNTAPTYYENSNGNYYGWSCAAQNRDVLCPRPWRLPTNADVQLLYAQYSYVTVGNTLGARACCDGCSGCGTMIYFWGYEPSLPDTPTGYACDNCGTCSFKGSVTNNGSHFPVFCVRD